MQGYAITPGDEWIGVYARETIDAYRKGDLATTVQFAAQLLAKAEQLADAAGVGAFDQLIASTYDAQELASRAAADVARPSSRPRAHGGEVGGSVGSSRPYRARTVQPKCRRREGECLMPSFPTDPTGLRVGITYSADLSADPVTLVYTEIASSVKPDVLITRGRIGDSSITQPLMIDLGLNNPNGISSLRNVSVSNPDAGCRTSTTGH